MLETYKSKYIIDNGSHIVAEKGETPNSTLQNDYKSYPPRPHRLPRREAFPLSGKFVSRGRNFRPGSDYSRRDTINSQFENLNQPNQPAGFGTSGSGGEGDASSVTRWLRPATRGGDWELTGTVLP